MDPEEQNNQDLEEQNLNQEPDNKDTENQEEEISSLSDDPVLGDMINRLTASEPEAPKVKPAEEDDGGDAEGNEGKPPEEPEDSEDRLKVVEPVKSLQQQVQEELARIEAEKKAALTTPKKESSAEERSSKTPEPQHEELDGLSDDEQDYYELLKYGSEKAGHQYTDHLKKFVDFTKKRNQLRDRILADDPDADLEDNDQLNNFTKRNRYILPKKEIRAIQRMQVREEVESELTKKYDKQLGEIDNRVKQSEIAPKVEAESSQFSQSLNKIAMNKEAFGGDETVPSILKDMSERGVQAVTEDNPLFANIVTSVFSETSKAAKELVRLTRFGEQGINVYKEEDPIHRFLVEFITQQDAIFAEKGGAKRIRDGKSFVASQVWTQLSPEERANKWTFPMEERLKHLQANAIMHMRRNVENLRENLKKAGYTEKQIDEQIGSQAAKKSNTPSSPKVKQTIPPGTASREEKPGDQSVLSSDEFAALGLPDVSA